MKRNFPQLMYRLSFCSLLTQHSLFINSKKLYESYFIWQLTNTSFYSFFLIVSHMATYGNSKASGKQQVLHPNREYIHIKLQEKIADTHSSLYCWISPSGNSPDGKRSITGIEGGSVCLSIDGGSVCSGTAFFFLHIRSELTNFPMKTSDQNHKARSEKEEVLTCFYFSSSSSLKLPLEKIKKEEKRIPIYKN